MGSVSGGRAGQFGAKDGPFRCGGGRGGVGKQGPGGGSSPSPGHKATLSSGAVPSPKEGLNGGSRGASGVRWAKRAGACRAPSKEHGFFFVGES